MFLCQRVKFLTLLLPHLILSCMICSFSKAQNSGDSDLVNKVKAAYILNFTIYTEWPDQPDEEQSNLTICIIGDYAISKILEQIVQIQKKSPRRIDVLYFNKPNSKLKSCQVAFLGGTDSEQDKAIKKYIENRPILTIGNGKDFIERGGIIGFVEYEDMIHFHVNLEVAEKANLKLSSRMLSLAKDTKGGP